MPTQRCVACGFSDGELQHLYAERTPDAQPVACVHKQCLTPSEVEHTLDADFHAQLIAAYQSDPEFELYQTDLTALLRAAPRKPRKS